MGADRYYRDAPQFRRSDPLKTWARIFVVASAGAFLWIVLLWYLMSTAALDAPQDTALGLSQTAWVIIAILVFFACLVGLAFVVVARVNRTRAEAYLDATGGRPEDTPPMARVTRTVSPGAASAPEAPETGAASEAATATAIQVLRAAARIETTMGPDGRMLLSYTLPREQPRGLYADTYVPVDSDAVLNVKTLLAKTPGAR